MDIKRIASKIGAKEAKHMLTPFVIIPLTRNDFQKLSDPVFLSLLASFGIDVTSNVYPRVDSSVDQEHMKQSLRLMQQTLDNLVQGEQIDRQQI